MEIKKLNKASVEKLFLNLKDNEIEKYRDVGFDFEQEDLECVEGCLNINDIELDCRDDFESAKVLFNELNLCGLTPEHVDDERLWVYLTHFTFFPYSKERWGIQNATKETIIDRFFYTGDGRGARTRNAIARLWWISYLTFNNEAESEEEKWKYTKAVFSSQDLVVSLFERKIGSYSNVRKAFLDFYIDQKPSSKAIQYLTRKLNHLGGVFALPGMSGEELIQVLNSEYKFFMD